MMIGRRFQWFLLAYFVLTLGAGCVVAYFLGNRIWQKVDEKLANWRYAQRTHEGQQKWGFDSGTIGSLGGVKKYAWEAQPSITEAQRELREQFRGVLGKKLDYQPAPELDVVETESLADNISRVIATVPAEAGFRIKTCVMLPADPQPAPAVILSYGVGGSVFETSGYDVESYHNDMAMGLAKAGYVAVTYELRGLGQQAHDWGAPEWRAMNYDDFIGYTLLRGSCAMGVWVHDGLQVLDAVSRHPRVDPQRMGFAGISHGGQIAMYAAALEPERIHASIAMGSFLSFEQLYTRIHNMTGHAIPGIAEIADMGDLAALVAPRPLLVQWGELERDTYGGPLTDASLSEFDRTMAVYQQLGAAEHLKSTITPGAGHGFDVAAAVEFLDTQLRERPAGPQGEPQAAAQGGPEPGEDDHGSESAAAAPGA